MKKKIGFLLLFSLIVTMLFPVQLLKAQEASSLTLKRLAGQNRVETAVTVSQEGWNTGSDVVILTREDDFPDALAGVPLANAYEAPILLTNSKILSPETEAEIKRLKPSEVYVLGGLGAISSDIEQYLMESYKVIRIGGNDRYETAARIAKYLNDKNLNLKNQAIVAPGSDFPDALAVSSWAAQNRIPILLSETDALPSATESALKELKISKTIVVGGAGVISDKVLAKLSGAERYAGADRYKTAFEIAKKLSVNDGTFFLATGLDFPDALAGSAFAARTGEPIILVDPLLGGNDIVQYLQENRVNLKGIYILGGEGAVPQSLVDKIATYSSVDFSSSDNDQANEPPVIQSPKIEILSPSRQSTFRTTETFVDLAGNASEDTMSVSCNLDNKMDIQANGTKNWEIPVVNLEPGDNVITVTATNAGGKQSSDTVIVKCETDSDGDGLSDILEKEIGTDPSTSGDEVLDADSDGLDNLTEYDLGTNPLLKDSDGDDLNDGDEVYTYFTDPLSQDTDGDGIKDGTEVKLGLDPSKVDTDNDGVNDSKTKITQTLDDSKLTSFNTPENVAVPQLSIHGTGDVNETTSVLDDSGNYLYSNVRSVIGHPIDIKTTSEFDTATLSFKVKPEALVGTDLGNLAIAYFDETNNTLLPLPSETNSEAMTVSTQLTHFSKYALVNRQILDYDWDSNNQNSTIEKGKADIVFVLDSTGSMGSSIDNVKNNIVNFVSTLDAKKVDVRLGLVEFKDIIEDGPEYTRNWGWFTNPEDFKSCVSSIYADGGGNWEESDVDGLEVARTMGFRNNVTKFIVLLTDAPYREETRFPDLNSMSEEIRRLKADSISTSVISDTVLEPDFQELYTTTDGLFSDIYSDFSTSLNALTSKIGTTVSEGVWIRLTNGTLVHLKKQPDKTDLVTDSDEDGIPDSQELTEEVEIPYTPLIPSTTVREPLSKVRAPLSKIAKPTSNPQNSLSKDHASSLDGTDSKTEVSIPSSDGTAPENDVSTPSLDATAPQKDIISYSSGVSHLFRTSSTSSSFIKAWGFISNPALKDTDGDGIPDKEDANPSHFDNVGNVDVTPDSGFTGDQYTFTADVNQRPSDIRVLFKNPDGNWMSYETAQKDNKFLMSNSTSFTDQKYFNLLYQAKIQVTSPGSRVFKIAGFVNGRYFESKEYTLNVNDRVAIDSVSNPVSNNVPLKGHIVDPNIKQLGLFTKKPAEVSWSWVDLLPLNSAGNFDYNLDTTHYTNGQQEFLINEVDGTEKEIGNTTLVLNIQNASSYDEDLAVTYSHNNVYKNPEKLCAEFVSDCLSAGGLTKCSGQKSCNPLYRIIITNNYGRKVDSVSSLKVGDLVFWGPTQQYHTAIITKIEGNKVYVTQHNRPHEDILVDYITASEPSNVVTYVHMY